MIILDYRVFLWVGYTLTDSINSIIISMVPPGENIGYISYSGRIQIFRRTWRTHRSGKRQLWLRCAGRRRLCLAFRVSPQLSADLTARYSDLSPFSSSHGKIKLSHGIVPPSRLSPLNTTRSTHTATSRGCRPPHPCIGVLGPSAPAPAPAMSARNAAAGDGDRAGDEPAGNRKH